MKIIFQRNIPTNTMKIIFQRNIKISQYDLPVMTKMLTKELAAHWSTDMSQISIPGKYLAQQYTDSSGQQVLFPP